MTLFPPSLHDRVTELEDHVYRIYDWTHAADERAEQQRNRLDFVAQGITEVRRDMSHLTTTVDRLETMLVELLALTREK